MTERAKHELMRTLSSQTDDSQEVWRMTSGPANQLNLYIGTKKPRDLVFKHKGSKILAIERSLASQLKSHVIDARNIPTGVRLVVFGKPRTEN
jgi:hypothetical protein